jgi:hypothetical protein
MLIMDLNTKEEVSWWVGESIEPDWAVTNDNLGISKKF